LPRRRLRPSCVNGRLRPGGRRLCSLNRPQTGLTKGLARTLHRSASTLDCCRSVQTRLLRRGPRTKARSSRLLPC
jgi:hypothetical protein